MTTTDRLFSIGEVSELTGISTHTLRFYEKEGLLVEPIARNAAGRRLFSEQDVGWLRVGSKLRSTGMPLPDIRRYAELVREGAGTVEERFRILRAHEARVREQLADLQDVLSTIEAKVAYYADRLAEGTADRLWLNGPECAESERSTTA
jgi:DNA-binding transcriptional MerR regulator